MVWEIKQALGQVLEQTKELVVPQAGHFDLSHSVLVAALLTALGIIGFLVWNIYSGLGKRLDNIDIKIVGVQGDTTECRDTLAFRFADKEDTQRHIDRLFERQDKLRENLPVAYISRQEMQQILDGFRQQVDLFRVEVNKVQDYVRLLIEKQVHV